MAIIYEKTPGALIPTGDRMVSTFPSGLVRVDQSFICKTSSATTHRNALAIGNNFPNGSYPAIDGLIIFPAPQEVTRNNGFTEFIVSAYGRSNAEGITDTNNPYSFSRDVVAIYDDDEDPLTPDMVQFATRYYDANAAVIKKVITANTFIDISLVSGLVPTPIMTSGPEPGGFQDWPEHNYQLGIESVVKTNYGDFSEIEMTAKYF